MELNHSNATPLARSGLISLGPASTRREEAQGRNRPAPANPVRTHLDSIRTAANNEEAKANFLGEVFRSEEGSSAGENILALYLPPENLVTEQRELKAAKDSDPAPAANYTVPMESRAVTAPARPRTEVEKFRCTAAFSCLEGAAVCANQLIQRADDKFDLDSSEGQKSCRQLLGQIESLCECFRASCGSRKYRTRFSQAYRVLYREGALCYLTEILDAAQERIALHAKSS